MSFVDRLFGRPLASQEEDEQKIGPLAGVPLLGLDALSSSAYGPEAALTLLIPLGALGLVYIGPIIGIILALLAILFFSYRQTIAAYPTGGGSYTVAKENLGTRAGLLAAAALLLDYVLNAAVGISAGVGALVSAVPALHPYILPLCLGILLFIAFINLRGVRESGTAFAVPTVAFVALLGLVLVAGLIRTITSGGHPVPLAAPPLVGPATAGLSLWLLVRAFSSGCTAMTGVEAVSNGVMAFRAPSAKNAQRALTLIVVLLGLLLAGIAFLARVYHVGATDPESAGYQSVVSQLAAAVLGRDVLYYVTIGSVLAVLCLSANTSFAGFPQLCRLIAHDDFLPHAFANRGRRLVYSLGISILTGLAALLLIAFGGITDRLIPLFAVGAFGAFTLSQAGMVVHWRRHAGEPGAQTSLIVNAVGAFATGVALLIVLAAKFLDGAWITLLLVPALLTLFTRVKAHYDHVNSETACPGPLDVAGLKPPVVVVPIKGCSTIAHRALRFALQLSPDVIVTHISTDEGDAFRLRTEWEEQMAAPIRAAGLPVPRLMILSSPFRRLFHPLLRYINALKNDYPDRQIAVIIPELVESRWYQYLLHNQRATGLKAALLLRGDNRVVVINVPWYLGSSENPAG